MKTFIQLSSVAAFVAAVKLSAAHSPANGRWSIQNFSLDEFGDFDLGDEFNVLIVLP